MERNDMAVECFDFKPYDSGALRGFANIRMPLMGTYLELYGCSYFKKGDQEWISPPSREYINKDGQKKYSPIARFTDGHVMSMWSTEALNAVKEYISLQDQSQPPCAPVPPSLDSWGVDIPF